VVSRAALKALSRGARRSDIVTLDADMLDLDTAVPQQPATPLPQARVAQQALSLREAVDTCQRECIRAALQQHGNNWAQAARTLGIDASNLHKLARRLGLKQGSEEE
jgi:anaerobic nitric oxide reductase transcription regulator